MKIIATENGRGSTDKPFCDGTHPKAGFDGARAAVQSADAETG